MRQGILVTGLLFLIAVPTMFLADGGSNGGHDQRARSAKTKVDPVKTLLRSTTARGGGRPIRAANRQPSSGNAGVAGGAVAVAERLAQGAASRYGGARTDDDPYLVRPNVWATNTAESGGRTIATGARVVRLPGETANVAFDIQSTGRDGGAAARRYAPAVAADGAEVRASVAAGNRGQDVDPDPAAAARQLRSAAARGDARAQLDLAAMYVEGTAVQRDYAAAFMWYTLAAHSLTSSGARALVIDKRNRLARAMTPAERADADAMIRSWRPKSLAEPADILQAGQEPAVGLGRASR